MYLSLSRVPWITIYTQLPVLRLQSITATPGTPRSLPAVRYYYLLRAPDTSTMAAPDYVRLRRERTSCFHSDNRNVVSSSIGIHLYLWCNSSISQQFIYFHGNGGNLSVCGSPGQESRHRMATAAIHSNTNRTIPEVPEQDPRPGNFHLPKERQLSHQCDNEPHPFIITYNTSTRDPHQPPAWK